MDKDNARGSDDEPGDLAVAERTRQGDSGPRPRRARTLRLSEEADDAVQAIADELGLNVSEVIRRAIGTEQFFLEARKKGERILLQGSDESVREVVLR